MTGTTQSAKRGVLVTGAGGFVGAYVVDRLLERGYRVIAVARHPAASTHTGLTSVVVGDLNSLGEWQRHLDEADCVVHLAGRAHHFDQPGTETEEIYRRANVDLTEALYRAAARSARPKRFVYMSSIKASGERTPDRPFRAGDPPMPEDAYGRSKLAAEQSLQRLSAGARIETVIVRPPLVYGPRVGANFLRLMRLADSSMPIPLGAARAPRCMVSAWNLADLVATCIDHPQAASRVFLAADAPAIGVGDLLRLMRELLGRKAPVFDFPLAPIRCAAAVAGASNTLSKLIEPLEIDDAETRAVLGWSPPLSLHEGIARTIAWFQATPSEQQGR